MSEFIHDGQAAPRKPGRPSNAEIAARNAENAQEVVDRPVKRTRKPFGSFAQKLDYPRRDGYHRHWFNDTPGRIERATEAGYEHVKDDKTGEAVKRPVGTSDNGGVLIAYLMEIPEEWYREDMAAQQEAVDRSERAIANGKVLDSQGERVDVFRNTSQGRQTSIRHGQR